MGFGKGAETRHFPFLFVQCVTFGSEVTDEPIKTPLLVEPRKFQFDQRLICRYLIILKGGGGLLNF
jgi:hypothetical protein